MPALTGCVYHKGIGQVAHVIDRAHRRNMVDVKCGLNTVVRPVDLMKPARRSHRAAVEYILYQFDPRPSESLATECGIVYISPPGDDKDLSDIPERDDDLANVIPIRQDNEALYG